ncbi:hypothetical protein CC1G_06884 [Coprinopsis cinerea okayama7|uniref:SnoaL-like domain-containing protein n=1 Tax=Coprinopsis cinerea (strain Okayama-7 / 130 / ATCC MYA-4618 / FGSC 9003) TaxID=240176 RepID=A8N712_COPC7|nr:hypothetical protein CC1G_06884 [Coprinopsis cinerea okayama7\|eukprot:XP_001830618.2 hypothetical protein CC1G_06884 [Coprinopsis cinerea okayama7\
MLFLLTPFLNFLSPPPASPVADTAFLPRQLSRMPKEHSERFEAAAGSHKPLASHRQRGEEWVTEMYASLDSRDPTYLDTYIGENASFIYNTSPPIIGKDALQRLINWECSATKSFVHNIRRTVVVPDLTIAEAELVYVFLDGTEIKLNMVTVFEKAPEDKRVNGEVRIYGDFTAAGKKLVENGGPRPNLATSL